MGTRRASTYWQAPFPVEPWLGYAKMRPSHKALLCIENCMAALSALQDALSEGHVMAENMRYYLHILRYLKEKK